MFELAKQLETALNHFDHYMPSSFENVVKSDLVPNCHWPYNVIEEEDGATTYEIAVVGKTKEDIKISSKHTDTIPMLIIEVNDEKKETKRKVLEERIKRGQLRLEISIEPKYDLDNLKATVANGLLTVTVPLKAKPEEVEKQYTIE